MAGGERSEEHTSELQSHSDLVCRLLLEKKKNIKHRYCDETSKKKADILKSDIAQIDAVAALVVHCRRVQIEADRLSSVFVFFFNDTATTEIYTLSLHDALPIYHAGVVRRHPGWLVREVVAAQVDRKSTRLNSSHTVISYAVFCLKKKKKKT